MLSLVENGVQLAQAKLVQKKSITDAAMLLHQEMALSTAVLAQDAEDVLPIFFQGADPDPWDGEQLLGCYRVAGGQSPQCAVVEDPERWQATPPCFDQTPSAKRRLEPGFHLAS